jgi:hypothetical protein
MICTHCPIVYNACTLAPIVHLVASLQFNICYKYVKYRSELWKAMEPFCSRKYAGINIFQSSRNRMVICPSSLIN